MEPELFSKVSKPHRWVAAVKNSEVSGELVKLEKGYYDKVRFYTFWLQIERLKAKKIVGTFAELGVFKGETAKIIYEMDSSRKLLLFDTFEGFADQDLQVESDINEKIQNI